MRVFANCLAVALCVACGQSTPPASTGAPNSSRPVQPTGVTPAEVMRVRTHLPAGYEVAGLSGRAAPVALWGFGTGWTAEPPQCGGLADPAGDAVAQGFSASGSGGIIYVAVADAPTGIDQALVDSCGTWTLFVGGTHGTVTLVDPPKVQNAPTVGMATDITTVVEGGTETHSHADTFVAYLDRHVAYVTVLTDPGSSAAPLGPDAAAQLLVETVSAVRG